MADLLKALHQGAALTLECTDEVYRPGPLTLRLADLMRVRPGETVVDVGCGTGYLGLLAARLGAGRVICTDLLPEAVRLAEKNARRNGLCRVEVRRGDALAPLAGESADLILTLPPQMPFPTNFNPGRYGGPDGTDVILRILRQAVPILAPRRGRLHLIHSAQAHPGRVWKAIAEAGFGRETVATVEKEWRREEAEALQKGLYAYLIEQVEKGEALFEKRRGRYFYPVWFYRLTLGPGAGERG